MIEKLVTHAILEDHFTGVLRHIAHAQEDYSKRTMALNAGGNVLMGMGTAVLGFGVKSIAAAGKVDEFRRVVAKVRGEQEAAFATNFVDNFDKHSSFAYFDLIDAAKRLEIQHGDLGKSFSDVADIAATSGRSLMDVVQVYDAVQSGRVGLGLSAKGGFAQFGINPKDIFEAEGIAYHPGMKLQDAMTPQQVLDGVHKVLQEKGKAGFDKTAATTTLRGAQSMIEGAMERLEKNVGDGKLPETVHLLNEVAGAINTISEDIKNVPGFGDKLFLAGGSAVLAGGILKGVAAWRQYKAIVNMAKIAGDAERAGEAAKIPIAKKEGEEVANTAAKYGGLRGILVKLGTTTLGTNAAAASSTRILAAGIGTMGLYAIGLAALAVAGYEVTEMFLDSNKAARDFEQSIAAVNRAKAEGYDLKKNAGQAEGFNALPVWKQIGEQAVNTLSGVDIFDTTDSGSSALTDAHSRALAKKHGMAKNGIRAQAIHAAKVAKEAAAEARRQAAQEAAAAAGEAANKYELDPALSFKLQQDERHIDLLKTMGGHEKELKAARAQEIADLNTAAGLLEKQARIATDAKKKYALMNEAADDRQKAKLLALEKTDSQSALDKFVAKIFGGGGIGEDDILKRTGVGRSFFASMKGGKAPVSPLHAALTSLAKRPLVLNLHLGDKPFAQLKSEIKDEALSDLVRDLEGSSLGKIFH